MFDSVSFVLFATSSPILVNFALRHPYPWLHAIFLAQCFALISSFAALIDAVFLRPLLSSSLKSLPTAVQQSVWTRLLKEPAGDALSQFMQQNPNSPIIRYFGVLNSERLLLTHPKDIQQVLDSQAYEFGRSYLIRRLLSPVLGKNSLVVSDGAEHIKCRADIHSDFYSQHVAELCPMFWQNAGSLIEAMTACSEGLDGQAPESNHAIDIVKWLEKAAFQIIVSAFFGSAACSDKSFLDELLQEFRGAFSISSGLYAQAEMAWETILPLHVFFGLISLDDVRKAKRSMQGVRALCQKHIAQRRAKYTPNSRTSPDTNILDTAIKSEDLSDEEILEICTTFLATGYKKVSVAATWAIYFLSTRPGVQALLRTEVRTSFPEPDQVGAPPVTAEMLPKMPVLMAVINETLRVAPPVHLTYREAQTDVLLSGSGQIIPEGTILAISPWAIHRSSIYWRGGVASEKASYASHTNYPSLLEWNMTRWLSDKKGGAKMQCSFLPFGRGPRCCIAEPFARDEMAILLAALVARFDFSFKTSGRDTDPNPQDLRVSFGVIAKPMKLMVRAQPVRGW